MSEIKSTPGPWPIERDRNVITSIGPIVAQEYAGAAWLDVSEEDALVASAAPDMALALEMLAAEADAGTVMIPSALRLTIDAALIKAGRKAAPVREKPCETCGGRGEVGGWRQGDGYGTDPCPDCSANSSKAAPEPVRHVTIAGMDRAADIPLPDPAQVAAESPDWIKNALPPEGA